MIRPVVLVCLAVVALAALAPGSAEASDSSTPCIACTLILGLLNQRSLQTGVSPNDIFKTFCANSHNKVVKPICDAVYDALQVLDLKGVDPRVSPEVACQKRNLCPTPLTCTLFHTWPPASLLESGRLHPSFGAVSPAVLFPNQVRDNEAHGVGIPDPSSFFADFQQVLKLVTSGAGAKANINRVFNDHLPLQADDADGDAHSPVKAAPLRATSWRGRDCNDKDGTVYPGRKAGSASGWDEHADTNCNGISGTDPTTGTPYEKLYCDTESNATAPLGMVVLGDSATAHFRLPPFLLNATTAFDDAMWNGVLHMALNEADWPACGGWTGYEATGNCPTSHYADGSLRSLYTKMYERNRCMHRDYTNVGVNGARTGSMAPSSGDNKPGVINSFTRNQTFDNPALVVFALIGNDVCNGHPGFGHYTQPADFKANVIRSLDYLNASLPAGSHVLFAPLADGLVLYETLHARTHPIGVTYADLYSYLICLGKAPCLGWMSSNATLRNETQAWANNLSAQYPAIIAERSYKNFDMAMLPVSMMGDLFADWVKEGKDPAQLIEPSDGFHPSQTTNMLTADTVYNWLEKNKPEFLGPINPHNDAIKAKFGDQGGY